MTITLQDLQVLNEKCLDPTEHGDECYEFREALVNYYRSGALQRLAELAEDGERYRWLIDQFLQGKMPEDLLPEVADMPCETLDQIRAAIDSARAPSVKEGKS